MRRDLIFRFSIIFATDKKVLPMFEFDQYLGFLAFLTILTIGFWLMIFLISIIPYWIGGSLIEKMKLKKAEKQAQEQA